METLISILIVLLASLVFAVVGTVLGCLLAGIDRKITARMQGRVGPPILQPYYDVRKLLDKQRVSVNDVMGTYEPMVLLLAVGFFLATGTFDTATVLFAPYPIICSIWGVFIGLLFILTIKLRKSPFDLSYSHHAHQDLVKGVTTEMSGPMLAQVEIMHWCENILFLGWVGMFFVWGSPIAIPVVIIALALIYFLEIWIDNNFARVKWQLLLKSAWIVTLVAAGINIAVLIYL